MGYDNEATNIFLNVPQDIDDSDPIINIKKEDKKENSFIFVTSVF